jgi:hypothetical protein
MKLYLLSEKIEFTSSSNSIVLPNTRFSNFGIFTNLNKAYQEAVGYYKSISYVNKKESTKLENYQSKIFEKSEILQNLKIQREAEELSPLLLVCQETQKSYSPADLKIWTKETKSIFIQVFDPNPNLY